MTVGTGTNERRRGEILDAAVRVLTERGFEQTRVGDVADACGVSAGLVHYYFESRERLLLAALVHANDRYFLRLSRALRTRRSAIDQLALLIDLSLPGSSSDLEGIDDWALWVELWAQALHDPAAAGERETLERRFRLLIRDVIELGQATGEFRHRDDPRRLGVHIGAIIDGIGVQILMGDADFGPEESRRACLEISLALIGSEKVPDPAKAEP
jgi:AcrR family transcriptional regulator